MVGRGRRCLAARRGSSGKDMSVAMRARLADFEAQQGHGWYIADWKRIAATVQVLPLEGICSSSQRGCRHACALYECAGRSSVRIRQHARADVAASTLRITCGNEAKFRIGAVLDEVRVVWHRSAQCLAGQRDRSRKGFAALVLLCMSPLFVATFRVPRRIRHLS